MPVGDQRSDRVVVVGAAADRVLEDRWVRCQTGHRQIGDVLRKPAAAQQFAGDVVEPEALPQVVELARVGVHRFSCGSQITVCARAGPVNAPKSSSIKSPMHSTLRSAAA